MEDDIFELEYSAQERALDAFYGGYIFEGVQRMHGHLESCVRALIFLSGPQREARDYIHVQNVSQDINLSQGVKCLYALDIINKDQYDKALHLNKIRNRMVHELHSYKALKKDPFVKTTDLEKAFQDANDLSNEFILQAAKT